MWVRRRSVGAVWSGERTEGVRYAAAESSVPVVDSAQATVRLRERFEAAGEVPPRMIDRTAHPTQAVYDEVGDMLLEVIDRDRLLPDPR